MDNATVSAFLKSIAKLCMARFVNINRGGCGVYALAIAEGLESLDIYDYNIRLFDYRHVGELPNIAEVERIVREINEGVFPMDNSDWIDFDVNFCHIVVEWNGYLWDCEGEFLPGNGWKNYVMRDGAISPEALAPLLAEPSNWNIMFDRSQIRPMREFIANCFRYMGKREERDYAMAA